MDGSDDLAALLGAFERDVARFTAQETLQSMREIKKCVIAEVCAPTASWGVVPSLGAWAASVVVGVRHVLQRLADDARRRDVWLDECVCLLEDVVMTAASHLQRHGSRNGSGTATDAARVRGAMARVLAHALSPPRPATSVAAAYVDVGLLVALCWLLPRQHATSRAYDATQLLDTLVASCRTHSVLYTRAAWARFVQGVVVAVHQRDEMRALHCMKEAVEWATQRRDDDDDDAAFGALYYWYAVLLSRQHNDSPATLATAAVAIEQLHKAVACNYSVVASLNLEALLAMRAGDLHAAAMALERSIDVDFDAHASLFNYAVLLSRMGNYTAQYQMLAYYADAMATVEATEASDSDTKRARMTTVTATRREETDNDSVHLFTEDETARLFLCSRRAVERGEVALAMAMAATAAGAWHDAREKFEAYFEATVDAGSTTPQTARRHYIYVLLQCDRHTEALGQCVAFASASAHEDLWVDFYRADALLCLEHVDECEAHLKNVIEPRLDRRLRDQGGADADELVALHVQLLNNLAVAAVCRGDVDAAVTLLRDGARQYPTDLAVQFNLTLLLWRLERRDAACALWFRARDWNLQMNVGDMREQQRALEMVARVEDEALCSASPVTFSAHISDLATSTSGAVDEQQLRYVDALVLHHWGNAQESLVAKTAAQYVEYLESLSAKAKPIN